MQAEHPAVHAPARGEYTLELMRPKQPRCSWKPKVALDFRSGHGNIVPRHRGRTQVAGSDGETGAALGATTGQNLAAVCGLHASTKAVVTLALDVAGLIGAFGGHGETLGFEKSRPRTIARRQAMRKVPLGTIGQRR